MSLLVVQPDPCCPPGYLTDWLLPFRTCRAYDGEPVPGDASELTGLVVLGGHANAYDDERDPWLTSIKTLLADAVRREVPTLGICLGHQLLAVATGGSVTPRPGGRNSGVIRPVFTAEAMADPLLGVVGDRPPASAWNGDTVAVLPPGAVLLATGDDDEVLSFRIGPAAWGVQWHPEASYAIVAGWYEEQRSAVPAVARGLAEVRAAEAELRDTWRGLGLAFAELVVSSPVARR